MTGRKEPDRNHSSRRLSYPRRHPRQSSSQAVPSWRRARSVRRWTCRRTGAAQLAAVTARRPPSIPIDLRRIELVVDERRGQRARRAAVAGRRSEGREITPAHRRRRRKTDGRARIRSLYLALIAAEEKQLVLSDGAAQRAAELVALQTAALRGEEIPRVEFVITHELEQVAMKFIRARFRDDVDRRRGVMAVARGQGAGLGLEFLQGVGEWHRQIQVIERVVMRAAV